MTKEVRFARNEKAQRKTPRIWDKQMRQWNEREENSWQFPVRWNHSIGMAPTVIQLGQTWVCAWRREKKGANKEARNPRWTVADWQTTQMRMWPELGTELPICDPVDGRVAQTEETKRRERRSGEIVYAWSSWNGAHSGNTLALYKVAALAPFSDNNFALQCNCIRLVEAYHNGATHLNYLLVCELRITNESVNYGFHQI